LQAKDGQELHFYLNLSSFLFSLLLQWQMLLLFSGLGAVEPFLPESPRVLHTTLIEFKNEDVFSAPAFVEEPVSDSAIIAEELLTETMVEESVVEAPQVEEFVVEEDLPEEPLIEELLTEAVAFEEPLIEELLIEEPVIKQTVIEEPVIEELVVEEQIIEKPAPEPPPKSDEIPEQKKETLPPKPDWLKNLRKLATAKNAVNASEKNTDPQIEPQAEPQADSVKSASTEFRGTDEGFINLLRRRVLNCRRYPDAASRNRRAGVVELELQIGRDGVIKNTQIVKGSGSIILDEAALSISACIGKLPAIAEEMRVSVPVHYQMRHTGRRGGR
jgi:TonB family protein